MPSSAGGGSDIWIGEQGGTILDYHNGALSGTPVVTLPNVFSQGECGLLGLAFDPNYATNGYVYISYVISTTNSSGTVVPYSRLSRFTASGGTINPATEKVLYQGNQAQNLHHAGNDLQIGPDGKLWWSVGENVPAISNGEALNNMYGKVLRFNLDGTVPADNPFVNVPSAVPGIYAYGLRNPFRFTFLPNGQPMVENTGSSYWEDLDTIQSGGNYGWDYYEGNCGSCGYLNPAYAYGHYPVDGAASAIAAYSGSTFPAAYDNVVFFGDYNRRDIEAVTFDPTYQTEVVRHRVRHQRGDDRGLGRGPGRQPVLRQHLRGHVQRDHRAGAIPGRRYPRRRARRGHGQPGGAGPGGDEHAGRRRGCAHRLDHRAVDLQRRPDDLVQRDRDRPGGRHAARLRLHLEGRLHQATASWLPSYYAEIPGPFYGPASGVTSGSFTVPNDVSQTPGSYYRITLTATDSAGAADRGDARTSRRT